MTVWALPTEQNRDLFRQQLNAILAQIQALQPGHGASLPSTTGQPDGRYFSKSGSGAGIYQLQGGAWVLVAS